MGFFFFLGEKVGTSSISSKSLTLITYKDFVCWNIEFSFTCDEVRLNITQISVKYKSNSEIIINLIMGSWHRVCKWNIYPYGRGFWLCQPRHFHSHINSIGYYLIKQSWFNCFIGIYPNTSWDTVNQSVYFGVPFAVLQDRDWAYNR